MKNTIGKLLRKLMVVTFLFTTFLVYGQSNGFVTIGGGGYVTSVIGCSTEKNLFYAKTDVGGVFRWQEETTSWKPLFGWVANNQTSYLGVEAVAIDPQSPNKIYALVGTEYWDGGKSAILRSSDYGETYEITDVTTLFKVHGNGSDRQKGESLAVDPNKGDILFCGTRYNKGLFKSTDSGVSWQKVTSLNVTDASISFVAFDASSGTKGTETPVIYLAVNREGENLFVSKDGGDSWSNAGGNPQGKPQRYAFSSDGNLYVTYIGTVGGVRKMELATGIWTNCTPELSTNKGFSGIDVDQNNPSWVVTTTYNMWWNEQAWGWADFIYFSEDGGKTWKEKANKNVATFNTNGIPWIHGAIHWAGCATFNSEKPGWVFVVSGNGVFASEDISVKNPIWKFMSKGLEETVMLDLISIPGGPMISSVGDQGGFVHTDINQAPNKQISQSSGFAFAGLKPTTIARVATDLYLSEDNAASWKKLPATPDSMAKGKVAVSANGETIIWKSTKGNQEKCYYTTDKGKNWNLSAGVNFNFIPMADPVNPTLFYAYNRGSGYLYRSIDRGKNFQKEGFAGTNGNIRIALYHEHEGSIWIAMGNNGLKYSEDSGQTFNSIDLYNCEVVAIGTKSPETKEPSIFIYGRPEKENTTGIYWSIDKGQSWERVDDDQHQYGFLANAGIIEADRNNYGRIYRSTAGMGIPYFDRSDLVSSYTFSAKNKTTIYPNPFSNTLQLEYNSSDFDLIQIFGLDGKLKLTSPTNKNGFQTIELGSEFKNGLYIVKLKGSQYSEIHKVIKMNK